MCRWVQGSRRDEAEIYKVRAFKYQRECGVEFIWQALWRVKDFKTGEWLNRSKLYFRGIGRTIGSGETGVWGDTVSETILQQSRQKSCS